MRSRVMSWLVLTRSRWVQDARLLLMPNPCGFANSVILRVESAALDIARETVAVVAVAPLVGKFLPRQIHDRLETASLSNDAAVVQRPEIPLAVHVSLCYFSSIGINGLQPRTSGATRRPSSSAAHASLLSKHTNDSGVAECS